MKHIKTFENTEFKKYIISDFRGKVSHRFYMFRRIQTSDQNDFEYDKFWYYDDEILETIDDHHKYIEYKSTFDIIFETNSLKDALVRLKSSENIYKYNL